MARSANQDPVERFRFRLTVISLDLSITGVVESVTGLTSPSTFLRQKLAVFTRAGFSEVTLPSATVNEMNYRENLDNQRFSKIPGLTKYEPVVLRRGVTDNRDLYEWYQLVNNDIALLNVAQELSRDAKISPVQSDYFRKDVIIEVLDRSGAPIRAWYLFNTFPSSYKGGNDLSADTDEKLVEELGLSYEFFLEIEGGIDGLGKELTKGATEVIASLVLDNIPFVR